MLFKSVPTPVERPLSRKANVQALGEPAPAEEHQSHQGPALVAAPQRQSLYVPPLQATGTGCSEDSELRDPVYSTCRHSAREVRARAGPVHVATHRLELQSPPARPPNRCQQRTAKWTPRGRSGERHRDG